ncbi:hypothetical protein GJ496_007707 [Pomphorhynchus laevis]|nr:hypothetical protein GJ496_007707 [Pomphorhynchus laevis]
MFSESPVVVIHCPEIGNFPTRMSISSNLVLLTNFTGLNIARLDTNRLSTTNRLIVNSSLKQKHRNKSFHPRASFRSLVKWSYQRSNPVFAYCSINGVSFYVCRSTDAVCTEIPCCSSSIPYSNCRSVRALDWSSISENLLALALCKSSVDIYDYRDCKKSVICLNANLPICRIHWSSFNANMMTVSTTPGCIMVYDIRKCTSTSFSHTVNHDFEQHTSKFGQGCLACIFTKHDEMLDSDWNQFNQHRMTTLGSNGLLKVWDLTSLKSSKHEVQVQMSDNPSGCVRFIPQSNQIVVCTTEECILLSDTISSLSSASADRSVDSCRDLDQSTAHLKLARKNFNMNPPISEFDFLKTSSSLKYLVGWSKLASSLVVWKCPARASDLSSTNHQSGNHYNNNDAVSKDLSIATSSLSTPLQTNARNWKRTFYIESTDNMNSLQIQNEFALIRQSTYKNLYLKYADCKTGHCQLVGQWRNRKFLLNVNCPAQISIDSLPSFTFGPTTAMPFLPPSLSNIVRQTCLRQVHKRRLCLDACLRQISLFISGDNSWLSPVKDVRSDNNREYTKSVQPSFRSKTGLHGNGYRSCSARFHSSGLLSYSLRSMGSYSAENNANILHSLNDQADTKFFRSRSLTSNKGKRFLQLLQSARNHSPPAPLRNSIERPLAFVHMFTVGQNPQTKFSINSENIFSSLIDNASRCAFTQIEVGKQFLLLSELWNHDRFNVPLEYKLLNRIAKHYRLIGNFKMSYLLSVIILLVHRKYFLNLPNETLSNQIIHFADMMLFSNLGQHYIQAIEMLKCLDWGNVNRSMCWQNMLNMCTGGYTIKRNSSKKHRYHQRHKLNSIRCFCCRLPVYGLAMCCEICGHGGHINHLQRWFTNHNTCRCSCLCRF